MSVRWRWPVIGVVLIVAIVGAIVAAAIDDDLPPTAEPASQPTASCSASLAAFAKDDSLMRETLSKCESVEDWLAGYRDHPTMIGGLTTPIVDQLRLACGPSWASSARACIDAEERGFIEGHVWPK